MRFILLCFITIPLYSFCQDKIITSNNNVVKCEILDTTGKVIKYKDFKDGWSYNSSYKYVKSFTLDGKVYNNKKVYIKEDNELMDSDIIQDGYIASNGITYRIGDTIRFGYGSGANKDFIFVTAAGGVAAIAGTYGQKTTASFANKWAIIKKIRSSKISMHDNGKLSFLANLAGTGMMQVNIFIEDAIQLCEVIPCKEKEENSVIIQNNFSVADELKKFKELLDTGVITQEEFDIQKSKLLNK
jgi:hypothetical protein